MTMSVVRCYELIGVYLLRERERERERARALALMEFVLGFKMFDNKSALLIDARLFIETYYCTVQFVLCP
jgi:hypothetical protein